MGVYVNLTIRQKMVEVLQRGEKPIEIPFKEFEKALRNEFEQIKKYNGPDKKNREWKLHQNINLANMPRELKKIVSEVDKYYSGRNKSDANRIK